MAWKITNSNMLKSGHLYYEVEFDDGTFEDFITDANKMVGLPKMALKTRSTRGATEYQRSDNGEWATPDKFPAGVSAVKEQVGTLGDDWLEADIERQVARYLAKRKPGETDRRDPRLKGGTAHSADVPQRVQAMVGVSHD